MNFADTAPLGFSPRRVGVLAEHAFREAVRQRVFQFTTLLAAVLVLGSLGLRELDFGGAEAKFVADFGHGALVLFGSVLTIVMTVQLLGGELENRTVLPVLARPVRRSEFICGKFLGAWAVVLVFCAVVTALLLLALWLCGVATVAAPGEAPVVRGGAAAPYAAVLLGGALQAVKFALLTAMVLLVGSYAQTSLFAQASSFLVLVICHLQYLARDAWQSGGSWAARLGGGLIGFVFPNFQLFGGELLGGDAADLALAGRVAAYGALYTAVFLGLAVWSFRRREI
ncbi:MAG TPA: ABC transporter permease [Opitutaceae bacterium]|nr:ABC transporter permease [Opitutaceae bacterium]